MCLKRIFLSFEHCTNASHTPTQETKRRLFAGQTGDPMPRAQPENRSHRCVSRILIARLLRAVSGKLAEAGCPAPRPRPVSSVASRRARRARRQSAVATGHAWCLGKVGRLEGGVLGEETADQLELLLLFLQKDVDQQLLLALELLHNGLGNVGYHPRHHQAEEHHQILTRSKSKDCWVEKVG